MRTISCHRILTVVAIGMLTYASSILADEAEISKLSSQVDTAKVEYEAAHDKYINLRRKLIEAKHKKSPYSDEIESSKKQLIDDSDYSDSRFCLLGESIEVGELEVTLKSYGKAKRKIQKDSLFGKPKKVEVELWGVLVQIRNKSKGRIIEPFRSNSFMADAWVMDNWDNRTSNSGMSDYKAQEGAGFVLADVKLLPEKELIYLVAFNEPEVMNFEYVTIEIKLRTSNTGTTEHVFFLVPKDKIVGIK